MVASIGARTRRRVAERSSSRVYSGEQVEALFGEIDAGAGAARPVVICTTTCGPGRDHRDCRACVTRRHCRWWRRRYPAPAPRCWTAPPRRCWPANDDIIDHVGALSNILCPRSLRVGAIGDASRAKLAINLILQNNRAALAEGIAFAEAPGARRTRLPGGGAAIGRLFPRHGHQGREDVDAGLSAAVTYLADIEGCRVDHRGSRAMRPASAPHHHPGRTVARGDRDSRARTATAPRSSRRSGGRSASPEVLR